MTDPKSSTIFISYSWDSEEHKRKVRNLADCLSRNGLSVGFDQYVNFEGNWDEWMEEKVTSSEFVLLVITDKYLQIQAGKVKKGGFGAAHEGLIIRNQIYKSHSKNKKFIPIFFPESGLTPDSLPSWIGTPSAYLLDTFELNKGNENNYTLLYRVLTNQPVIPGHPEIPVINLGSKEKKEWKPDLENDFKEMEESLNDFNSFANGLTRLLDLTNQFLKPKVVDVEKVKFKYSAYKLKEPKDVTSPEYDEYLEKLFDLTLSAKSIANTIKSQIFLEAV